MRKIATISTFSSAFFMLALPALAADALDEQQFEERFSGAVSALNAKVEIGKFHSSFDEDGFSPLALESAQGYFIQGAVSLPLTSQFGLQIDAGQLSGEADVNFFGGDADIDARGLAAHLFWRDAGVGLLGIYGSVTEYEIDGFDIDNKRIGVEGEAYLDRITLKGFVGKDFTDFEVFGDEDYVAASAGIDYYLTDNFMVGAGVDHSFEQTAFNVGFEMLGDMGGVSPSIFTDVSFNDGDTTVMAGLRVYLAGDGKSLIRRHREDDPATSLFDNISSLGNCLAGIGDFGKRVRRAGAGQTDIGYVIKPKYDVDGCNSSVSFGHMGDID